MARRKQKLFQLKRTRRTVLREEVIVEDLQSESIVYLVEYSQATSFITHTKVLRRIVTDVIRCNRRNFYIYKNTKHYLNEGGEVFIVIFTHTKTPSFCEMFHDVYEETLQLVSPFLLFEKKPQFRPHETRYRTLDKDFYMKYFAFDRDRDDQK